MVHRSVARVDFDTGLIITRGGCTSIVLTEVYVPLTWRCFPCQGGRSSIAPSFLKTSNRSFLLQASC